MMRIGRRVLLGSVALLVSGEALATESIICSSADGKASASFLVGTTPGLKPLSLSMEAAGKSWATAAETGATAILVAQSFADEEGMKIDISDDNAERIIAKLRVAEARDENSETVQAGTLMIAGVGAWPVTCSGE
jgi:hypothetical protein